MSEEISETRNEGLRRMEQVYGFEMAGSDPGGAEGDFFRYTADHLFADIWSRPGMSDRDRLSRPRLVSLWRRVTPGATVVVTAQHRSGVATSVREWLAESDLRLIVWSSNRVEVPADTPDADVVLLPSRRKIVMQTWPGKPYPLGATFDGTGVNFALFSEVAERVELCLIDDSGQETRVDMPELDGWLHYRMVDVSSIKELARRWYPRAYFQAPKKGGGHRALADILESVQELRYYRQAIMVPPPGPSSDEAAAIAAESWNGTSTPRPSASISSAYQ